MTIPTTSIEAPVACPRCMYVNPVWRSFCEHCKQPLRPGDNSVHPILAPTSNGINWWQGVRLLAVVIILFRSILSCVSPQTKPVYNWQNFSEPTTATLLPGSALPVDTTFFTTTQVLATDVITLTYPRAWTAKKGGSMIVLEGKSEEFVLAWYPVEQDVTILREPTRDPGILARRAMFEKTLRTLYATDGAAIFTFKRFNNTRIGKFPVYTGVYHASVLNKDNTVMQYVVLDVVCGVKRVCYLQYAHKANLGHLLSPQEGAILTQLIDSIQFSNS